MMIALKKKVRMRKKKSVENEKYFVFARGPYSSPIKETRAEILATIYQQWNKIYIFKLLPYEILSISIINHF
jgi:hypothetical protein